MPTHSKNDDLVDELLTDHEELREMFAQLRPTTGPTDTLMGAEGAVTGPDLETTGTDRQDVVRRMTAELVRHSVAEEIYLYPLIRKVLPNGDKLADHEIDEHAEVEHLLKDLENLDPRNPAYADKVGKVIGETIPHLHEEETEVFPQLREACSPEDLHDLGDKIRRLKKVAPIHPHPSTPDTPPANRIIDPMTGIVDRVRDALAGLRD